VVNKPRSSREEHMGESQSSLPNEMAGDSSCKENAKGVSEGAVRVMTQGGRSRRTLKGEARLQG
jgi:hypothetical protein